MKTRTRRVTRKKVKRVKKEKKVMEKMMMKMRRKRRKKKESQMTKFLTLQMVTDTSSAERSSPTNTTMSSLTLSWSSSTSSLIHNGKTSLCTITELVWTLTRMRVSILTHTSIFWPKLRGNIWRELKSMTSDAELKSRSTLTKRRLHNTQDSEQKI